MEDIPASDTDPAWIEEERIVAFWDGGAFATRTTRHPNRGIGDAATTLVVDGTQVSAHTSHRLDTDPPGRLTLTDSVAFSPTGDAPPDATDRPLRGDPLAGRRTTALTWGSARGTVDLDGRPVGVDAALALRTVVRGTHDRPELRHPAGVAPPRAAPQRWWHRVAVRHRDEPTGVVVTVDQDAEGRSAGPVTVAATYRPGTRWPATYAITLPGPRSDLPRSLHLAAGSPVPLLGLGEHHPTWVPGRWHDEAAAGVERWRIDELDPTDIRHLHVLVRVEGELDGRPVHGVAEALALGPHRPSGLTGFTAGWSP